MDKILLSKVKDILQNCNPDNCDKIKKDLMVLMKPHEADEVYQYFIDIERTYVKDTCKVQVYNVLPQYNDYFTNPDDIASIIFDIVDENESFD